MGKALLILLLGGTIIAAFRRPQVSVYAYYLMSIMAPQFIWPWVFEGIPAFSITAGMCILAFIAQAMTGKIDFSVYKDKQSIALFIFWFWFNLSDWVSPISSFRAATSADLVLYVFNIIMLMYFVSLGQIRDPKTIMGLTYVLMGAMIYYIYWSNLQYFEFNIRQFNYGRLMGPIKSPYQDENKFAILFVIVVPFLLFGIIRYKSLVFRMVLGLALLFSWHSIFLTASRGALLAAGVAMLFAYTQIKSKAFGIVLLVGFVVALLDQGGFLVERTNTTVETATESEDRVDPRLQSWAVGYDLMKKHPLTGVGVQRFQEATRLYFPGVPPYVAHNTLLNYSANSGVICGLIYLLLFYWQWKRFLKLKQYAGPWKDDVSFLNNSISAALVGFFVGSMFLDLIIFEVFFLLCMLGAGLERAICSARE